MDHDELLLLISELPPRQQLAIQLRYGLGLIWSEVAREMKTSELEAYALADDGLKTIGCDMEEARTSGWGNI